MSMFIVEHTYYIQSNKDNPTKNITLTVKFVGANLTFSGMLVNRSEVEKVIRNVVWKEYTYELIAQYIAESIDVLILSTWHSNMSRPYVDSIHLSDEDIDVTYVVGDI